MAKKCQPPHCSVACRLAYHRQTCLLPNHLYAKTWSTCHCSSQNQNTYLSDGDDLQTSICSGSFGTTLSSEGLAEAGFLPGCRPMTCPHGLKEACCPNAYAYLSSNQKQCCKIHKLKIYLPRPCSLKPNQVPPHPDEYWPANCVPYCQGQANQNPC